MNHRKKLFWTLQGPDLKGRGFSSPLTRIKTKENEASLQESKRKRKGRTTGRAMKSQRKGLGKRKRERKKKKKRSMKGNEEKKEHEEDKERRSGKMKRETKTKETCI